MALTLFESRGIDKCDRGAYLGSAAQTHDYETNFRECITYSIDPAS